MPFLPGFFLSLGFLLLLDKLFHLCVHPRRNPNALFGSVSTELIYTPGSKVTLTACLANITTPVGVIIYQIVGVELLTYIYALTAQNESNVHIEGQ